MIRRFVILCTLFFPLGALLTFHGLIICGWRWVLAGICICVIEGLVALVLIDNESRIKRSKIFEEMFETYFNCRFREVPFQLYFPGKHYEDLIQRILSKRVKYVRVPRVIHVEPQSPGQCIDVPVTYDTGVVTLIFVPQLPVSDSAAIRFQLLHELGHRGPRQPFEWRILALINILNVVLLLLGSLLLPLFSLRNIVLALGLMCFYWTLILSALDERYLNKVKRELIADEYAIGLLTDEDCEALQETFRGELKGNTNVMLQRDPATIGDERFESPTSLLRWQAGLDNIQRKLAKKEIDETPLSRSLNIFPMTFGVTFLLTLASSATWRWVAPPTVLSWLLGIVTPFLILGSVLYVGNERNAQEKICSNYAPLITDKELKEAKLDVEKRLADEAAELATLMEL